MLRLQDRKNTWPGTYTDCNDRLRHLMFVRCQGRVCGFAYSDAVRLVLSRVRVGR